MTSPKAIALQSASSSLDKVLLGQLQSESAGLFDRASLRLVRSRKIEGCERCYHIDESLALLGAGRHFGHGHGGANGGQP